MSRIARSVKNVTKGYSSVQVKVREATSNDAWGPTGTQMQEVAQMTYNGSTDFYEIMDMLDKRLNDKGKNWRHVLKSLKVLDYILHEGSELVITWSKKNIYIIKTLREFVYVDDEGRDVGQNVRVAAKELTSLIQDDERLRSERKDRKSWKSRVTGLEDHGEGMGSDPDIARRRQADRGGNRRRRGSGGGDEEEDLEYKLAIEASKNQAEEDARRRQSHDAGGVDDPDLQKALKLSQEEEELRRKELESSNGNLLFDDTPAQPTQQPQATGFNYGYQQQGAVDFFGNPIGQQQQQTQNTGYLNNMYSQPTGYGTYGAGLQQNGFDQFGQPQQTNYLQAQQTLQPQQTAFNANPYQQQQQQQNNFGQFGQQPQQQDTLSPMSAGSHNPFGAQQQQPQTDSLKPMPTGSNNPFSSGFGQPQQPVQPARTQPSLNTISEQRTAANPITNFASQQSQQQQQQQQLQLQQQQAALQQAQANQSFAAQQRTELDPHRARLNAMLASGDGMDTFGNTGDVRIPAQHTAPGAFVNSSGQNLDRLRTEKTGNNPFMQSQMTGMPSMGGQQMGGFGMPQAQTGFAPAGAQGNNPFGQRGGQPGAGSLIDL